LSLYNVQVWWREVPDPKSDDSAASLFNKVVGYEFQGDYLRLYRANGDTNCINLQSTQCINIIEVKQQ